MCVHVYKYIYILCASIYLECQAGVEWALTTAAAASSALCTLASSSLSLSRAASSDFAP